MQTLGLRFPELLIWSPLIAGLLCFIFQSQKNSRALALISSILTLVISAASLAYTKDKYLSGLQDSYVWMKYLGASFNIGLDGM